MRFAIRDDDTCFFTDPEDLESLYRDIWDTSPVSLAVVPYQSCTATGSLPPDLWQGDDVFPIGENARLVAFLRRKLQEGRIRVMLHGYSHKDYVAGPEFVAARDLGQKIKDGKAYLENLLQVEIDTFVPPHNSISRAGLCAVIENRLNLLGHVSFRPWHRRLSVDDLVPFVRKQAFFLRHWARMPSDRFFPWVLQFAHHGELVCHNLNGNPANTEQRLLERYRFVSDFDGDFCVAVHYWELRGRLTDLLLRLLAEAHRRQPRPKFIGAPEFFQ